MIIMTMVFNALIYVPAVLSGIGYINTLWLGLSVAAAWIWSIFRNSPDQVHGYGKLDSKEFMRHNNRVTISTIIRLSTIAAVFGVAYLFR